MRSLAPRSAAFARKPRLGSGRQVLPMRPFSRGGWPPAPSPSILRRPMASTMRCRASSLQRCAARPANIPCASTRTRPRPWREAEEEALRQTVAHADLADGQSILELGCGWGSLSLWMAISDLAHPGRVELQFAARIYRGRGGQTRSEKSARGHGRYECVCSRRSVRPHCFGQDVRAYDELAATSRSREIMAQAGRSLLCISLSIARAPICLTEETLTTGSRSISSPAA